MRELDLASDFPLPDMDRGVCARDTMHAGDDRHYVSVGLSALQAIEAALDGSVPSSILDLPSGFGRVTRTLRARFPQAAITACDLDAEGVRFCAERLGVRAAVSVPDFRDLRLGDTYDLIWVGSLITHLPAHTIGHFLAAMRRHMTQRSTLIISSHGPHILSDFRERGNYGLSPERAGALIADFERTGFGYGDYGSGERQDAIYGVSLTNESYGISVASEAWLRAALARCGLLAHAYSPRAWDDHHDLVVARLMPQRRRALSRAIDWLRSRRPPRSRPS